ncbi:MAG: hypothetical protein A3E85_04165 [Gammaproteobacteria bacterium RIFCSPHIGHO2_12_FULL_45_12]|nr:MAG: hypothetical protein A3E85_04165 [Gammaproteobacteria bacterium RIFCSPHIGHO2_12_FULL_45_12]
MSTKLIRLPKVLDLIGGSRSWVYKEIAEDRFPKPILLGKRSVVWIEDEIYNYIEQRINNSRCLFQAKEGK